MRHIRLGPRELLSPEARNAAFWRFFSCARGPLLQAAWLHRATISRRHGLVAVVGSYGKTTTTRAVRAVLGLPVDHWAQLNANCFGLVAWTLLRQSPRFRYGMVEVGIAGPGQMRQYVSALKPTITVVTCVGQEHIQAFRSLEHLRDEKAEAVRCLPARGVAILNGDDLNVVWMASQTRARTVTFGLDPCSDVSASDIHVDWPQGTTFTLHFGGLAYPMRVRLLGRPMVYPILAAAAVGVAAGKQPDQIVEALVALSPTLGRLQAVPLPGGAIALRDDYKSTVETVHAALEVLRTVPARRRVVVLGGLDAPPHPQRAYYRAVGEHIAQVADRAFIVGAELAKYGPGLRRGGMSSGAITGCRTLPETVAALRLELRPDDVVLVKGREGQRMTRVVLALAGVAVGCDVDPCRLHLQFCDDCSLLVRPGRQSAARGQS